MPKGNTYKKVALSRRRPGAPTPGEPQLSRTARSGADGEEPALLGSFASSMSLHTLQDKIKRQPDMYRVEFANHLEVFQQKLELFKENPAKKDDRMDEYFKFLAHVSGVYKEELSEFLSTEILNLLQQYYSILNPVIRMTLATCLKIMRGKDVVSPSVVLPVLLKLFRCEDKHLRKFIHAIVIGDLKRLNQNHKVQNINRKLQNFIFTMLQDQNEGASRRSLNVMIELYKRRIWNDEKTVNVIAEAVYNANAKIVVAACKFFLILDYDYESEGEESSDEDKGGDKMALIKQRKGSKMTKNREGKLERAIKQEKRKQARKGLVKFSTDFLPIDTIYDPQTFAEKLFSKLKKSNDKYEVKLYMLRLISRMIGRHKIQLLSFYPNLLRYLNSHNKDKISEIFAMIIESCHDLVPPETIKPVIERIISNYVTEYCNNAHITIGINAIREVLMRMPLALDPDQIEYLCLFRSFRNKSVSAAAKSLVNYFRDVCPELLPKKMRGRFAVIDEDNEKANIVFGAQKLHHDIEGIELLKKAEKIDEDVHLAADRILDDHALKKIKILQLKEGVRRVDRHGFRDDDVMQKAEEDQATRAVREEYYHKMLELIRRRRMQQAEQQEQEDEGGDESEEGEQEMEEMGEDEQIEQREAAEGSDVSDLAVGEADESDDEEAPKLVPVLGQAINHENAETSSISDIDVDDYGSSSEYDSDELDVDTTANPHGFVYANMLETFSKSRKERIDDMRQEFDKQAHRDKFKKKKASKNIGKSEKVHAKNKPFMMMKKKKINQLREKMSSSKPTARTGHKDKRQLGHFRKSTQQRLQAKKAGRK